MENGQIRVQFIIEKFVNGTITNEETDTLWSVMLKDEEWYRYFEARCGLFVLGKEKRSQNMKKRK